MSAPVVPPRPVRPQTRSDTPEIPPRPVGRAGRSISPNPERFAQSPLNDTLRAKYNKSLRFEDNADPVERSKSIIPDVGEEGIEYSVIPDEQEKRTVGDIKLQAPKPKFPASAVKDRISTVTRTDSDRAAAFGIGKPSGDSQTPSLKKKASTLSQETDLNDDKEGIPEIGQRIPLLANAGDVQAPSPAPGAETSSSLSPRHHVRKTSARGFVDLPEDSYGLRGHGKAPKDKLDKAYYEKHPEIAQREKYFQRHEHDRASNHALDSDRLNKIVRETASRNEDSVEGIPDEQLGYEAQFEYAARMSRPASTAPVGDDEEVTVEERGEGIHIEGRSSRDFGREEVGEGRQENYSAPILAPDEVAKDPSTHEKMPAVEPLAERSGSSLEIERPTSRSTSRPSSTHIPTVEIQPTPLEEEEYEPLFPEDEKERESKASELRLGEQPKHRFPSKDVWEDAPNSVHATTEVNSPQPPEDADPTTVGKKSPEERKKAILQMAEDQNKPRSWVERQLKISDGTPHDIQNKFPSRDVWEDTPDSLRLEAMVSAPQEEEEEEEEKREPPNKAEAPPRPSREIETEKRSDVESEKPTVLSKPKPVVPPRPSGGKIAALQAGFMADLNKRLQAGPQALKKDEQQAEDLTEKKEATPLLDARKSRARGPQRRAPAAKSPGPVAASEIMFFGLLSPQTVWSIEPEKGCLSLGDVNKKYANESKTLAANMAGEAVAEVNIETKEAAEI